MSSFDIIDKADIMYSFDIIDKADKALLIKKFKATLNLKSKRILLYLID